jgi:hypothetical protein
MKERSGTDVRTDRDMRECVRVRLGGGRKVNRDHGGWSTLAGWVGWNEKIVGAYLTGTRYVEGLGLDRQYGRMDSSYGGNREFTSASNCDKLQITIT